MKTAYRIFALITLIAVTAVCFAGCGAKQEKILVEKEAILGTWEKQFEEGSTAKDIFVFYENGKYKHEQSDGKNASSDYGVYSISIDLIKTESNVTGAKREHEVTALDGDNMTWGSGSFAADYVRTEKAG